MLAAYLRERAAAALGVPAAAIAAQPLTALGLDSLSAVELKGGVEAALGIPVPLVDLLQGIGVEELAELLLAGLDGGSDRDGGRRRRCARSRSTGDQPLSPGQRGLWFLHRLAPEGGAYNIAVAARAEGLDAGGLRPRAAPRSPPATRRCAPSSRWSATSRCSGCCRSSAPDCRRSRMRRSGARLAARLGDGGLAAVRARRRAAAAGADLPRRSDGDGGGPARRPPHRGRLRLAGGDGAGAGGALPRREAAGAAGAALRRLRPLAGGDARRRRAASGSGATGGEQLAGVPRPRPAGRPSAAAGADLARRRPRGGDPAGAGRPPCASWRPARGATLFMTLLAAFRRSSPATPGQEDFAVGAPVAGRPPPELARLVGYFVNVLAAARRPRRRAGLRAAARPHAADGARGDGARRPAVPAASPSGCGRCATRPGSPIFQVMLVLPAGRRPQDPPGLAAFSLGEAGARLEPRRAARSNRCAWRSGGRSSTSPCALAEDGRRRARGRRWSTTPTSSTARTAERMLGHFLTLLAGRPRRRRRPRSGISRCSRRPSAGRWSRGGTRRPARRGRDLLLHQLFEAQAARTPEAEALVVGETAADLRRAERAGRTGSPTACGGWGWGRRTGWGSACGGPSGCW